jgi:hypothetical protein
MSNVKREREGSAQFYRKSRRRKVRIGSVSERSWSHMCLGGAWAFLDLESRCPSCGASIADVREDRRCPHK